MKKFLFVMIIFIFSANMDAKNAYSRKIYSKKSYIQKGAYSGFGKISKTTGRIKTKTTNGYFKPSQGKYVNPYVRS